MVYFEDNFWGEKNTGYDVLYHTMKYGLIASRELADFIRDRASVEEGYAKSLSKICKPTNTGISLGTFEPCWAIIKRSTEILANSHSQVVQKLQDLIKSIRDYGETQKESQKTLKDDLSATAEVVSAIQTKTAAVVKAKDLYYTRCQEFEKVKKETTNAKDIEKAEQKKIRAGEEYKLLIEKREDVRKTFHGKMIETAKKFEELELSHLKSMYEHLIAYIESLAAGQESVEKVIAHFRTQVEEQTTDKLLAHFVKEKGTGRNVPDEIVFEEFTVTGSLVELEVEESPNLNSRSQPMSAFRKKKKEKDKERKERKTKKKKEKEKDKGQTPNGMLETGVETNPIDVLPGTDAPPEVDEEGYRIIPKDTESNKSHDSGSDSDSDDDDEPKKFQITIKPAGEKTTASLDEFRSIQLTLPTPAVWQKKSESSSLDGDFPKTTCLNESNVQSSHNFSKSQEDLLSIDFSQPTISNSSSKIGSTTPTSYSSNHNQLVNIFPPLNPSSTNNGQVGDLEKLSSAKDVSDKPPELAPKKRISLKNRSNSNASSPALPPKKSISSNLSSSTGSLSDAAPISLGTTVTVDKEIGDDSRPSPQGSAQGSVSLLAPPRPEMPRTTSTGSMSSFVASRPRPKGRLSAGSSDLMSASISLKTTNTPTRTYGLSTTAANTASTDTTTTFSADLLASVTRKEAGTTQSSFEDTSESTSKTIWDRINSPSNQRAAQPSAVVASSGTMLQPTVANTSSSQVVKKPEDIIPVAVALVETVNAYFKGRDASKNSVTGDITVSFPASAINSLSAVENPPVLSFSIKGLSLLKGVQPNKSLILSEDQANDVDMKHFQFVMPALLAHLKKLAEQGQSPYYNIDILKYQVQNNVFLIPLSMSCYWKCEEKTTDVKVDYQYTSSCLSTPSPLNNVSVIVPVNGGVEIMQSKPIAKWSKEHQKALWQIQEVSNNSEGQGSSSLRAKFDLKEGPSVAQPIAVQFQCNGSTLSKIDFLLNTDMYKLSLVKRKIITGKYMADPK